VNITSPPSSPEGPPTRPSADVEGPSPGAAEEDDLFTAKALDKALHEGQLSLLYQPIFRLQDRRPVSVEALLRWRSPRGADRLPDTFIPCAERGGLIDAIGLFVLKSACDQIVVWRQQRSRVLPVSINVSAHQFRTPDFASDFASIIATSGVDPHALQLEITESALVDDPVTASARLDGLRALGVGIAIDDFGVGYSSLSRLRHYHIDTLKLDHSFVHDVADDFVANEVAATIIRLAHRLGVSVVAEGVETEAQYTALLAMGCDAGQGFLLSRPLAADDIPGLA